MVTGLVIWSYVNNFINIRNKLDCRHLTSSEMRHRQINIQRRGEDEGKTLLILICVLVAATLFLMGGFITVAVRWARRKPLPEYREGEVVNQAKVSDKYKSSRWCRTVPSLKKFNEEEKELRDAVKLMMLANSIPVAGNSDKSKCNKMPDSILGTETCASNAPVEGGEFSGFINFTTSKLQVESSAVKEDDNDNYLF